MDEASGIKIYTDGSCIRSGQEAIGVWVAIIFIGHDKIILKDVVRDTTHNRMELLAVIKAVEYLIPKGIKRPIAVHSDSQYVVQLQERAARLKERKFMTSKGTPIQNIDLVKAFIGHLENYPIEFIKVAAHQKKGDSPNYNREADMLCRKMARNYIAS